MVCSEVLLSTAMRKRPMNLTLSEASARPARRPACAAACPTLLASRRASQAETGSCSWPAQAWPKSSATKSGAFFEAGAPGALRRFGASLRPASERPTSSANLVSVYLHMGSHTRRRLKFITIAAARERHRPACCLLEREG